jgi:Sec-independent protein secretion pathway component TatC
VTMLIAMAPLLVLFELSIILARIFERRRARAAPDDRWDSDDDLALS